MPARSPIRAAKRKRAGWGDLSLEEIVLARRLQVWFDLEQEALPPLYLETLHEQIAREAAQSADSLEERVTQQVFNRLEIEQRPMQWPAARIPQLNRPWVFALASGLLTLLILLATFLYYPPARRSAHEALESLLQPAVQPTRPAQVQRATIRTFATIWEAQPYADFPIVRPRNLPAGFHLEQVQVRGSSAVALIFRRSNAQSGRWERITLLEYRTEAVSGKGTPFPTPQVIGPERELTFRGIEIVLVQHEATPDAEGTAQARWQADGLTFCLYGPLSIHEVQIMAGDVLSSFGK